MKDHKRQKFWQILFPLILFILIVLAVGILLIDQTSSEPAYPSGLKYANISIIYLAFLIVPSGLLILTMLGAIIYGLVKLLQITPLYSKIAQTYVFIAAEKIILSAGYVTKPFIITQSILAGSKKGVSTLLNSFRTISTT